MPVQCTCRTCGSAFTVKPYVVAKPGGGLYCSVPCRALAKRQRPSSAVCERCGEAFEPQPKTAGRYCSAACAGIESVRAEITCQVCGNTRLVKRSVIARGFGTYCGTSCANVVRFGYTEEQFWEAFWAKTRREGDCLIWTGKREKTLHGE